MSGLRLDGVSKRFGGQAAVDRVTLDVANGTFVCLLGPSGCGKTTLLRMIAGLEAPDEGRVILDGVDVTGLPPERRGFGMVFQSLALFPHLSVAENVAYPLRLAGEPRAARERRAAELLELVRLGGMGGRAISALSGGQRQRVAIARALAREPRLFLLDEPLSALDAKLREAMQVELRQLQRRLGVTTLVVTHDQREAMTMADLVVVISEGRVRQAGPPSEVYRRPADAFVADFIGGANLLPVSRDASGAVVVAGVALAGLRPPAEGGGWALAARSEDVGLCAEGESPLRGRVGFVRDLGATMEVVVKLDGGGEVTAALGPRDRRDAREGERVGVALPAAACRFVRA